MDYTLVLTINQSADLFGIVAQFDCRLMLSILPASNIIRFNHLSPFKSLRWTISIQAAKLGHFEKWQFVEYINQNAFSDSLLIPEEKFMDFVTFGTRLYCEIALCLFPFYTIFTIYYELFLLLQNCI